MQCAAEIDNLFPLISLHNPPTIHHTRSLQSYKYYVRIEIYLSIVCLFCIVLGPNILNYIIKFKLFLKYKKKSPDSEFISIKNYGWSEGTIWIMMAI